MPIKHLPRHFYESNYPTDAGHRLKMLLTLFFSTAPELLKEKNCYSSIINAEKRIRYDPTIIHLHNSFKIPLILCHRIISIYEA